jgi:hypothetical protein
MKQNGNARKRIAIAQDPRRVSVSTADREVMRALGAAALYSVSQAARKRLDVVAIRVGALAGAIDEAPRLL